MFRIRPASIISFAFMLCVLPTISTPVKAQDIYVGGGLPGGLTVGYARPMGSQWGLRSDLSVLSIDSQATKDDQRYDWSYKSRILGIYADWFPYANGFRLVGGLTFNDLRVGSNLTPGQGTATINGNVINMSGKYFNVSYRAPSVTPYVGIGYGHHANTSKGLGFYADLGWMLGNPTVTVDTNVVGTVGASGTVTQADVDAQKDKVQPSNSAGLPFFGLGVVYRY